ncbi:MAG: hypothetical protein ABI672_05525 [Vicinamibacteria bacterium]
MTTAVVVVVGAVGTELLPPPQPDSAIINAHAAPRPYLAALINYLLVFLKQLNHVVQHHVLDPLHIVGVNFPKWTSQLSNTEMIL